MIGKILYILFVMANIWFAVACYREWKVDKRRK